jgi:transcriptional regulator with XRE-family HTH domain
MLRKSLGERLAELRHEAGLSLRELGEKVGASAPHVRDVEVGNRQPSEALVEKMAAALGSDLDDLLTYSTRPPSRQMEELIEQAQASLQVAVDVVPFGHGELGVVDLAKLPRSKNAAELVAAPKPASQETFHRLFGRGLKVPDLINQGADRVARDTDGV